MTKIEFRAWRKRMGLNQRQLGLRWNKSHSTIRKLDRGELPVSGWVKDAMRGVEQEFLNGKLDK